MSEQPLSSAGQQRREAILGLMQHVARRRRIRRRALRATAACAVILLTAALALHWRPRGGGGVVTPIDPIARTAPTEQPPTPKVTIGRIETDPTIVQRWSVGSLPEPQSIDDDDLLRTLADAGEPAGLIQTGGQTILVSSAPLNSSSTSDTP
jgi:hypothetical protein